MPAETLPTDDAPGSSREDEEDDEFYWRAVDEDYNPNRVFAQEEEPSLDLDDYF